MACLALIALALLLDSVHTEDIRTYPWQTLKNYRLLYPIYAVLTGALSLVYPTIGALIVSRLPRNPIGWIFCGVGLLYQLHHFALAYSNYAVAEDFALDNNGRFVDDDRYELPNDHTLVFPNSRNEYFPPVTAHFRFSDQMNTVTFDLVLPKNLDECSESCWGTYARPVSVFFSELPWHRVCQADNRDNNVNGRTDELGEPCWIS